MSSLIERGRLMSSGNKKSNDGKTKNVVSESGRKKRKTDSEYPLTQVSGDDASDEEEEDPMEKARRECYSGMGNKAGKSGSLESVKKNLNTKKVASKKSTGKTSEINGNNTKSNVKQVKKPAVKKQASKSDGNTQTLTQLYKPGGKLNKKNQQKKKRYNSHKSRTKI